MRTSASESPLPYPWRNTLICVLPTLALSLGALAWFGGDEKASAYFALHSSTSPRLTAALEWFSIYGNVPFYCYYAVMLFVELKRRREGGYQLILACTCGFIATVIVASLFKFSVGRPRPGVEGGYTPFTFDPRYYSFPSGHVAESTVCALQLANHRGGAFLAFVCGIPPVIMGLSRLYLELHYPTDLLGGVMAGWLGAYAAWRLASRKIPGLARSPKFRPES